MDVLLRTEGARGSALVGADDAAILFVADRKTDEAQHHLHTLELGGIEIHCQGFKVEVETDNVFLQFTAHNITEASWDRFMAAYPDEWFDGSGLLDFDPDTGKKTVKWFPGASLVVGVSALKVEVLEPQEVA